MLLDKDGCKQQCVFTLEYIYQLPTSWFDPQEDTSETVMVTIDHVCFRCEQSALSFSYPEIDSKTRDITTQLPSFFSFWASFTTSNKPTSTYWALNDWPHVPVESRTIRTRYSHQPSIAIATRTIRPTFETGPIRRSLGTESPGRCCIRVGHARHRGCTFPGCMRRLGHYSCCSGPLSNRWRCSKHKEPFFCWMVRWIVSRIRGVGRELYSFINTVWFAWVLYRNEEDAVKITKSKYGFPLTDMKGGFRGSPPSVKSTSTIHIVM